MGTYVSEEANDPIHESDRANVGTQDRTFIFPIRRSTVHERIGFCDEYTCAIIA